jgi:hypothetical protein
MKRPNKQQDMTKQMERIQTDVQSIASEADSLITMATPGASSGGNLKKRLKHLQARVDRLRQTLWRVQSSSESQVVPFPSESTGTATEPSLVDRVLALIDRRVG